MGVPALFRWLSKKYPKIVERVVEDEPVTIQDADGKDVLLPVDMLLPNPNGFEVDNLYLDMNGIVHPCTHPEGKPPPETEEDMMLEIFAYTNRVVTMARPRKLLFLAIDGVAPRAKMNQQRSRRFRAVQEAREKDEEREAGIAMFEAMGKTVSEETKNKKSWDSNAITPGTPFMDLLASSLRYWTVQKLNSDPAWKNMQVIISDASVPGEGEHKIMDYIRRQRVNKGHDPNTQHVIYGLDADLIMLALATHEPNFRVLREDVFAQESRGCRICGEEGHYANQCPKKLVDAKDEASAVKPGKPAENKPFIFLDVSVLREYLEIELNQPHTPFSFNLEHALDDWVFLIFFVGNDFLPHLPSLEIREGAIDTLLRIWKTELPRMGGYLTNHGHVVMERAQIILEGLARREDEIFRKRRETEERQDQNAKRRKIEDSNRLRLSASSPSLSMQATSYVPLMPVAPPSDSPMHHSLPARPAFDIFTGPLDEILSPGSFPPVEGAKALGGSNADVVNNRRAIRMANMSAAEHLKAELAGLVPLGRNAAKRGPAEATKPTTPPNDSNVLEDHPSPTLDEPLSQLSDNASVPQDQEVGQASPEIPSDGPRGHKRKIDEVEEVDPVSVDDILEPDIAEDADEDQADVPSKARVVNPDGTVDQVDTVRLWEPGYKERYYRQKFRVELSDTQFRREITKSYLEGLSWVLHYYYQGTPSWQWYYPYHFAPFASDFEDVANIEIRFTLGVPFKPFEQLMGVFPAASRKHLPVPFQRLMVEEDSPILDFYPETFEIDMNGKKMAWQGVALLPFIDPKLLLDAMATRYPELNEDEVRRNRWGNNVILTADADPLYDYFCGLYTKKRSMQPVPIDVTLSKGISGSVLADPSCVPGSTYLSPFVTRDLGDIYNDRSISALYFYPKQLQPHRSQLLRGVRRNRPTLTEQDQESVRRGGNRGRGGGGGGGDGAYHNSRGSYGGGRDGVYGISGYSNGNGNGSSYYGGRSSIPVPAYPSSRGGYGGPPNSAPYYSGRGEGMAYGGYGTSYPPATYGGYGGATHHASTGYSQRGIPTRGGYGNGGYNTDRSFSYRGASRGRGR